jgi:hypothetical protein
VGKEPIHATAIKPGPPKIIQYSLVPINVKFLHFHSCVHVSFSFFEFRLLFFSIPSNYLQFFSTYKLSLSLPLPLYLLFSSLSPYRKIEA